MGEITYNGQSLLKEKIEACFLKILYSDNFSHIFSRYTAHSAHIAVQVENIELKDIESQQNTKNGNLHDSTTQSESVYFSSCVTIRTIA